MQFKMDHNNLNVTDMERSIRFYKEALGLYPVRDVRSEDGSFRIVFLEDGVSNWRLELTWLRDHPEPYDLGENESHLALRVDDFEAAHEKHSRMGCICYENASMGIYFIHDPDDYWLEICPIRD